MLAGMMIDTNNFSLPYKGFVLLKRLPMLKMYGADRLKHTDFTRIVG
jgi:hypothetical protein